MASLIAFPIDLSRTAAALEAIEVQLRAVVYALDRLAPPLLPEGGTPYQAQLSDLRRTDPATVAAVQQELELYAESNDVILNSDAFIRSIIEYERQIKEAYGPDAINDLPWNKAAGGPLFDHQARARAASAVRPAQPTDAESAPGAAP